MAAEWIFWGLAAAPIAAFFGMKIIKKRTKNKELEVQKRAIMNEFVLPFLPEVMSFYHLEVLGKDPFSVVDSEKLLQAICSLSSQETYQRFDRNGALIHLQELGATAKEDQQQLLKFLFWYLDYSNGILEAVPEETNFLIREAMLLEKQFAVWCICHEELRMDAPDSVLELIHYSSYFAGVLKEMETGVFREMMADDELRNERRGNFVRIIFQDFENNAQGLVELEAIEQFHEHFKKQYTQRNKKLIRF
ncbi:hypothetical protein BBI11_10755 [Planococcus maritimus]|uniref:hypothetical protein n=1 Tax=Planococcus maritimus TaxID=192421 RepID=UPI00080F08F1|nr:hypothetical protein [Planococcus maritimus]ANU17472.1 hypothetical protein BBI11_10755 [Planococcus maritimus]